MSLFEGYFGLLFSNTYFFG